MQANLDDTDYHCRDRTIWHTPRETIEAQIIEALNKHCKTARSTPRHDTTILHIKCGNCTITITLSELEPGGDTTTASTILGDITKTRVEIRYNARDNSTCTSVCRRIDLALFRGGG